MPARLIAAHQAMAPEEQAIASAASAKLRLQVAGSAPLPISVKAAWESGIGGGQVLLERYGMTETGLIAGTGWENEKRVGVSHCGGWAAAEELWDCRHVLCRGARAEPRPVRHSLSLVPLRVNVLKGLGVACRLLHPTIFHIGYGLAALCSANTQGCVGFAFPGMEIRLWDSASSKVITESDVPGDIECRGAQVTKEYWRNPAATEKEFNDGWFRTGDVGIFSGAAGEEGLLKILGRASVDIIKSGGEKISAVEIERAILELPGISDAAVVGLPDEEWGQIVAAVIVCEREELSIKALREELRSELAAYKLPRKVKVLKAIPRNAMGKVQKKLIVEQEF